ncbi:MAG: alpha/beta hydrolase fold protein [Acidimicrobiales bacterium]|nr:alpha/beta hydrolase fold protein [Acidimicrobiales bacterium]
MRVSSTDDVSLELHDLGGDGPTLLIAHATGFCAGAYRPLTDLLAEDFRVWALDFRAHGDSTTPSGGDLSWRGMADDVLAVAVALDDGPLLAFGHSMGGACLMAAELRAPGTIASAFLFEPIIVPPAFGAMTVDNPMAASARRRRPSFPSRLEALGRYASRPPLGAFRADALAAYVEHGFADAPDGSVALKCTPEHEAQVFEADHKPLIAEMTTVTTPTVVACGDRGPGPGPAAFAPEVADALPNGRLQRYAHLGHFGPFQDPDTLAGDIRKAFAGG